MKNVLLCIIMFSIHNSTIAMEKEHNSNTKKVTESAGLQTLQALSATVVFQHMKSPHGRKKLLDKKTNTNQDFSVTAVLNKLPEPCVEEIYKKIALQQQRHLFSAQDINDTNAVMLKNNKKNKYHRIAEVVLIDKQNNGTLYTKEFPNFLFSVCLSADNKFLVMDQHTSEYNTRQTSIISLTDSKKFSFNTLGRHANRLKFFDPQNNLFFIQICGALGKYETINNQVTTICPNLTNLAALHGYWLKDNSKEIASIVVSNYLSQLYTIDPHNTTFSPLALKFNDGYKIDYGKTIIYPSHANRLLACSTYDDKKYSAAPMYIELWHCTSSPPIKVNSIPVSVCIQSMAFSPCGTYLYAGSDMNDHSLYVWNIRDHTSPILMSKYTLPQELPLLKIWPLSNGIVYVADGCGRVHSITPGHLVEQRKALETYVQTVESKK